MDKLTDQSNAPNQQPDGSDDLMALVGATQETKPNDGFMDIVDATAEQPRVQRDRAEAVLLRRRIEHAKETDSPSLAKRVMGGAVITAMVMGGVFFLADKFIDALDHQAQQTQEVGNEYKNQPQDGGIDTLLP